MHKGASGHQDYEDLGQVATGGRGSVPGSPSPSIFRVQNSRVREKVRKGEGEPGDEARYLTKFAQIRAFFCLEREMARYFITKIKMRFTALLYRSPSIYLGQVRPSKIDY